MRKKSNVLFVLKNFLLVTRFSNWENEKEKKSEYFFFLFILRCEIGAGPHELNEKSVVQQRSDSWIENVEFIRMIKLISRSRSGSRTPAAIQNQSKSERKNVEKCLDIINLNEFF